MRKTLLAVCLAAFALPTWAENQSDTCFNYVKAQDYPRAIEQAQAILKGDKNSLAGYLCLGRAYYETGQLKPAQQALKEFEARAKTKTELYLAYTLLGQVYNRMGDRDNALLNHDRSLALSRELGDKSLEAKALNNLAADYQDKGNADKALDYYQQALALMEDESSKAATYNNMGTIYLERGDAAKAIELIAKAAELSRRAGNFQQVARWQLNLGYAYLRAKDYAKAEEQITAGLKGAQQVGDRYWEATGFRYLGYLQLNKGKIPMARMGLGRAREIFTEIGASANAQAIANDMKQLEAK